MIEIQIKTKKLQHDTNKTRSQNTYNKKLQNKLKITVVHKIKTNLKTSN